MAFTKESSKVPVAIGSIVVYLKDIPNKWVEATTDFHIVTQLDPTFAPAHIALGLIYSRFPRTNQDLNLGLAEGAQAATLFPCAQTYLAKGLQQCFYFLNIKFFSEHYLRIALQYFRSGIEDFTQAIACDPRCAKAYFYRAYAYSIIHDLLYYYPQIKTGTLANYDMHQAISDCRKTIEINSEFAEAYLLYPSLCRHIKGWQETRAVTFEPIHRFFIALLQGRAAMRIYQGDMFESLPDVVEKYSLTYKQARAFMSPGLFGWIMHANKEERLNHDIVPYIASHLIATAHHKEVQLSMEELEDLWEKVKFVSYRNFLIHAIKTETGIRPKFSRFFSTTAKNLYENHQAFLQRLNDAKAPRALLSVIDDFLNQAYPSVENHSKVRATARRCRERLAAYQTSNVCSSSFA